MGVLDFFSRRDPRGRIEFAITWHQGMYVAVQDLNPDRDCNAWLAHVLMNLPDSVLLDIPRSVVSEPDQAFLLTARFSLNHPEAALQLGLFVALSDFRAHYGSAAPPWKAAMVHDEYAEKLRALNRPFIDLMESGRFEEVWRERNPWTARHMPHIAKLITEGNAG